MDETFMKVEEIARRLGVSKSGIYKEIAEGKLRAVRLGKRLCVPVNEFQAWLHTHTGKPE